MKRKLLPLILLLLTFSLYSQENKTKTGLSGTLQSNQFGILIPIWFSEKFSIVPAFYINSVEKTGTDIGISIAPRFYLKKEQVSPYIGIKAGAFINTPSSNNNINTQTNTDFFTGVAFGGEYFLSDNFSFGVEAQGNLTKSNEDSSRFGNPGGISFNTGTMISTTIYLF